MAQETPGLVGVTWQWTHFASGAEEYDVPTVNYTITFADDGMFHAKADCNVVLGTYTVEDSTITILPGPTTLALCSPESLGGKYTLYLSQAAVFSFTDDGDLLLEAPADSGTMTFSAQPQVSGTVTYRVRMALPDDVVVRVQVQDVSIADAPTMIIGEQVIHPDGAQVPIPFVVSYPADAVVDSRSYSVSARITDGEGRLLFITDTKTPVITDGNPTSDIELVLVRVGS
ncbi:MAG: YbaY family lipoprotein [Anaerolineae bacterium]